MANDGGPAFPHDVYSPYRNEDNKRWIGMSLRDWFAGQALVALAGFESWADPSSRPDSTARMAYTIADAMLKARENV